jgi:hypothetical protein
MVFGLRLGFLGNQSLGKGNAFVRESNEPCPVPGIGGNQHKPRIFEVF